jgi:RNase P subunit RPR2
MKRKVFHPVTNEEFWAWDTAELSEKIDAIRQSFQCEHSSKAIFQVKIKSGKPHVKLACPICGESLGSPIKREEMHNQLQEIDVESIRLERSIEQFNKIKDLIIFHKNKDNEFDQNWWKEYSVYLESKLWKEKRELKLDRVNFICEGCGIEAATEVHHRSYEHVPFEMLFDLLALCRFCHNMLHLNRELRARYSNDQSMEHIVCYGCRQFDERYNRPWCSFHNAPTAAALASENLCGPSHKSLDPLK